MKMGIIKLLLIGAFIMAGTSSYAIKYILVSKDIHDDSPVPDEENAGFEVVVTSLSDAQNYIIQNFFEGGNIVEDIVIYVRGGNYRHNYLWWKATSPECFMKIVSYNHEKVIFDGKKDDNSLSTKFLQLNAQYQRTNLWIEGLTIQNFSNGIGLGKTERDSSGVYYSGIQNSHNIIKNNIFINIGNKFSAEFQDGFSALGLSNSTHNLIEGNVFYQIENEKIGENGYSSAVLIHAIYLANYSSNNTVRNNYVSLCSGGAFRLRNSCNNNLFEYNYIDQSGKYGFISEWYRTPEEYPDTPEKSSNDNFIKNNICTYPYPKYSSEIALYKSLVNNGKQDFNYIDGGNNFVLGERLSNY
jgi:hypothetical protein